MELSEHRHNLRGENSMFNFGLGWELLFLSVEFAFEEPSRSLGVAHGGGSSCYCELLFPSAKSFFCYSLITLCAIVITCS
jgi:hypothetical protein